MEHPRPGTLREEIPEDEYPPRLFHTPGNVPSSYHRMWVTMVMVKDGVEQEV